MDDGSPHLALVGMMGSGKTTVGRRVASALGRRFLDSDAEVERRTGRTVREIFESDGEPAFRTLETEALAEALAGDEPVVVAAAGGVVLDPANRRLLEDRARVVWLRSDPDELARRVRNGDHRPLLGDDPEGALRRLDVTRRPRYAEVADLVVDVDETPVPEVVDTILQWANQ